MDYRRRAGQRLPIGANLAFARAALVDDRRLAHGSRQGEQHADLRRGPRDLHASAADGLYAGYYDPEASVRHFVPASRLTRALLPPVVLLARQDAGADAPGPVSRARFVACPEDRAAFRASSTGRPRRSCGNTLKTHRARRRAGAAHRGGEGVAVPGAVLRVLEAVDAA